MNRYLLQHLIFPVVRYLQNSEVLSHLKVLEGNQWLTKTQLQELQWQKFKIMINHAYYNVPYYNRLFRKRGLHPDNIKNHDDVLLIPILTKKDIRENLKDLISKRSDSKILYKSSTGGSTGENIFFYHDSNYNNHMAAAFIRNDRWCDFEIGDRMAQLWGARFDLRWHNTLNRKIKDRIMNRIFLLSYDLTEDNMHDYATQLRKFNPKIIMAYPSALSIFADFLRKEGISPINPISIISCSETLFDYQKELIESVFNSKVYNRYGSREFACIAQECSQRRGLHINIERVFLEIIQDGRYAYESELGEIIVTDLDNFGMPFIRYKIGDIGRPTNKLCSCGRGLPLLEYVEGRVFDVIVGQNGQNLPGTFWTLLFRSVEGIRQFQVVQRKGGSLEIKFVVESSFNQNNIKTLKDRIIEYLGYSTELYIKIVDEIKPTKSGKFRFVISENPPDFTEKHDKQE